MRELFDVDAVSALSHVLLPPGTKGIAAFAAEPLTGASLAGASLFDGQFSFPVLALRDSAVEHNIDQLARFARTSGVELAPHAKTTMAPQVFARQLAAGAWGLTAATIGHVMLYRRFGVRRILLANELVDPGAIAWLAGELAADPESEAYCYVDSTEGVSLLAEVLGQVDAGRPLNVLVELGHPGGRTGCRTLAEARAVAEAAADVPALSVSGVAGYEGGLGHDRSPEVLDAVESWCRQLVELLADVQANGLLRGPGLVTAGGSAYPDVVARVLADRPVGAIAVVRSGSYVTHDDGLYAALSPFTAAAGSPHALRPALELWAQVLSRPEPGLAVLGFGRRDVGFDAGLPTVRKARTLDGTVVASEGVEVNRLNDQHAYLEVPESSELRPGDLVGLGISHPCTTIDRWAHLVLVDDDDRALDIVATFF